MRTFTKSYHYIMQDSDPRMTRPMKDVLCFLLSFAENDKIDQIFPSNAMIASYTGLSERTVKRATAELEKVGYITKTRRHNSSNIYTAHHYDGVQANVTPQTVKSETVQGDRMTRVQANVTPLQANVTPPDVTEWPTIRSNNKISKKDQLKEKGESQKTSLDVVTDVCTSLQRTEPEEEIPLQSFEEDTAPDFDDDYDNEPLDHSFEDIDDTDRLLQAKRDKEDYSRLYRSTATHHSNGFKKPRHNYNPY